jgi:hypothetical protein
MEVGGAKREESAPLPSQQLSHSHHSSSSYRVSLFPTAVSHATAAATEIPSFQQQSHCNSSGSYRIFLFPTAVSLQQQQLHNVPLSNSSLAAKAAAATEFSSFQQQRHKSCSGLFPQNQICCGISS